MTYLVIGDNSGIIVATHELARDTCSQSRKKRMQDDQYVEQLRRRFASGDLMKFLFFWGHQRPASGVSASCFSQWYDALLRHWWRSLPDRRALR